MLLATLLAVPPAEGGTMAAFGSFIWFIPLIALMYFMMIRPQKKREKQTQEMRAKVEVGDEIVTIGGMVGIVVNIKDDTLVIETGSDRSKIRIMRWAIQTNNTIHDTTEPVKDKK